ncbi:MAG TPA: glycosyltransferase family 1 protein [Aggregatilineales bacterium]|nr:glycosyltransferase family 1 protein [Aggregatilineales bacterium]
MRVMLFTETFLPKRDGIVTVICLLLDHLTKRGIETAIVAPYVSDHLGEHEPYYNQTKIIRVPGKTFPIYPELKAGPPQWDTYRQIKDFRPDIAHFIHPVLIGGVGILMAKRLNIPNLTSFHLDFAGMAEHHSLWNINLGFMKPTVNWFTRTTFNMADYTLAPSKLIQNQMIDLGIKNVGLWKRGVDGERFNPKFRDDAMRYELSDGHPEDTLLLYVGRLSNEKRIDLLRPLLERLPNTRLALVGDGPARADLEEHFKGLPVKFMGRMVGVPLSQAYASGDVFTFASSLETFGLVVVEAMAAGLPVVSSRLGGIPDVVEIGKTGYLFNDGDVEGLVEGVRNIISDKEKMKQMGRDARAYAETQTWDAMMDEVIVHYDRLITNHRTKKGGKRIAPRLP